MFDKIKKAVEKHRELILDVERHIWKNPESGYREVKTSKYMEGAFESLGYSITKAENIPGFYTVIDTGREGPEVLILGELDSLICWEHPESDKETGAVHCCGHNAQCASLLGIAATLKEEGILDNFCGRIRLCAVPAEELIEIEYRQELKKQGIIRYMGGKTEFLSRGYFDGVDLAFMVHTSTGDELYANYGSVGCIAKKVIYKGVASHAGGRPWDGCNALYAANLGLSAINSLRETFKEKDYIRVHPIITKGGDVVNTIPDEVVIESYVRGLTFEAIEEVNERVNRALCGAALSIGANIDIQDTPGYAPLVNCEAMKTLAEEAGAIVEGVKGNFPDTVSAGSTDMGDLSAILPVVHLDIPGAVGKAHGSDYYINNPSLACVESAKWQIAMLYLLLSDGGKRAYEIKRDFKPRFSTKEEFFKELEKLECAGDRIEYLDGRAKVRI